MSNKSQNSAGRSRTITWDDPKASARDAQSISGLDYLISIKSGKISPPPIARLVGYRISEIEHGHAIFELEPAEYHFNPFATVHGGMASTLLDTTMIAAVLSTLSKGFGCSTLEIKVNFIRPITIEAGLMRCEAGIIHLGKRIATAEGKVMNSEGRLYAHGVSTCMIFSTDKTLRV